MVKVEKESSVWRFKQQQHKNNPSIYFAGSPQHRFRQSINPSERHSQQANKRLTQHRIHWSTFISSSYQLRAYLAHNSCGAEKFFIYDFPILSEYTEYSMSFFSFPLTKIICVLYFSSSHYYYFSSIAIHGSPHTYSIFPAFFCLWNIRRLAQTIFTYGWYPIYTIYCIIKLRE